MIVKAAGWGGFVQAIWSLHVRSGVIRLTFYSLSLVTISLGLLRADSVLCLVPDLPVTSDSSQ